MAVGVHVSVVETGGTRTWRLATGERRLDSLEDGDVSCWRDDHTICIADADGAGLVMVHGEYGTFAHAWPQRNRPGRTIEAFLLDLSFDAFMSKASRQPHRIADVPGSIRRMKADLLDGLRHGGADRSRTRSLWESVRALEECADERAFVEAVHADMELYDRFCDGGFVHMVDDPGMRAFWNGAWSAFRNRVLAPIVAAEKAGSAIAA